MDIERKFLSTAVAELKLVDGNDGAPVQAWGYGSLFGGEPDSYEDVIAPGAYAGTIRSWNSRAYALPMLLQHGEAIVGKWTSLTEDQKGLRAGGELTPGHSVASDVAASLRHGALTGLSIGFKCRKQSRDAKTGVRTLEEIDLFELSWVHTPACQDARLESVKAAMAADGCDVKGAVSSLHKARSALAEHVGKAAGNSASMMAAMGTAQGHCGDALAALGEKPAKDMQLRELRELIREQFGVSRREAEEVAMLLVKARGAGDGAGCDDDAGDGAGAGHDGRTTGGSPREEGVGAGLLAALAGLRSDLKARTFL